MNVKDTEQVARTFEKLYSEVPSEILGCSSGSNSQSDTVSKRNAVRGYLESRIPSSDQKEIDQELKKTFSLRKQKVGAIKKPQKRKSSKFLTARERRDLGLYKLPKRGLKYEDFGKLHDMWQEYIGELVDLSRWTPGDESFQIKLCRADFHGGLVKVTRAKSSAMVGIEGIVVMETRNTFRIIGRDNVLRTVPKMNTSFTFRIGKEHVVTLGGSSLMMKPSERAVKKWKNKGPMDL